MKKTRKFAAATTVLAFIAVFLLGMSGVGSRLITTAQAAAANGGREIIYYNDMVNEDDIGNNNFNFGPNRKEWAETAVKDGKAEDVLSFIAKNDGTGDFFNSIQHDPALCAAIALDMDETLAFDEPILIDEQNELIGRRADAAHKHFLRDGEYWSRAIKLITERLCLGEISLKKIDSYTSSMYMYPDQIDGNRPSVIVRNTNNSGGTFVQFDLGKPGIVRYGQRQTFHRLTTILRRLLIPTRHLHRLLIQLLIPTRHLRRLLIQLRSRRTQMLVRRDRCRTIRTMAVAPMIRTRLIRLRLLSLLRRAPILRPLRQQLSMSPTTMNRLYRPNRLSPARLRLSRITTMAAPSRLAVRTMTL